MGSEIHNKNRQREGSSNSNKDIMKTIKKWRKLRLYRRLMKLQLKNGHHNGFSLQFMSVWAKTFVDYYFKDVWK